MDYWERDVTEEAFGYTESLDRVMEGLCLDYERREGAINNYCCTGRTSVEYKYYNYKMYEGAAEIVGFLYAKTMIHEIGHRIGYAKTAIDCMSESTYKQKKLEVKINMARKLHLLD